MFTVVLLCFLLLQVHCLSGSIELRGEQTLIYRRNRKTLYRATVSVEEIDLTGDDNEEDIVIMCKDNGRFYSVSHVTEDKDNETITPSKLTFRSCPPPKKTYMEALKEINIDASRVSEIFFDKMADTDLLTESMFSGMPLSKMWFRWNDITYIKYINSTENFHLDTVNEYTIDCHSDSDELTNRQAIQSNRSLKVSRVIFDECTPPRVPYFEILPNLNIDPVSVKKLELYMARSPSNLEAMHFKGLSLSVLIIHNRDRELDPKIFEVTAVEEVFLHHVKLKTMPKSSVKLATFQDGNFVGDWGNCSTLKSLSLRSFSVSDDGWLRNCHNLTQLFLRQLSQADVEHTLIGAHAVNSLSIVNCSYGVATKPIAENAVNLRKLVFRDLTLYNLTADAFSNLKNLEELDISFNRLNVYEMLVAITPLENLRRLTLYDSKGTFCGDYRDYRDKYLPLHPSYRNIALQVERGDFQHSQFSDICFEDWNNLTYLSLSSTEVRKLQLINLPVPRKHPLTVNLRRNKLTEILENANDANMVVKRFQGSQNITILLNLRVMCDCESSWFVWALRRLPQISFQSIACRNREKFKDFFNTSVVCNKYDCDKCTCRTSRDDGATVADCNARSLHALPMVWSEVVKEAFLKKILASNNLIKTLPEFEYPESLTEVDLSNNKISHISETALRALFHGGIRLSLSGNPLVCVCETQGMVQLLTEYKDQVPDYDKLTCSNLNTPLSQIANRSLCTERTFLAIGILSASLLALAAITAFTYVRYKLTIKAFLYARGLCLSCVREEELDADREYDAFVSYAHPDDEFVEDVLLPGLENDYKLCVHTRNWMLGEMINTQIMESVQKSRRTIIVLSKSFVESIWGMTEFRTAYWNSLREGRVRVICIVVDDVINDVNLDSELKSYLKSNTYLEFNDPWFWQKLRYAMPHHSVTSDQSGAQNQNEEEVRRCEEVELDSR